MTLILLMVFVFFILTFLLDQKSNKKVNPDNLSGRFVYAPANPSTADFRACALLKINNEIFQKVLDPESSGQTDTFPKHLIRKFFIVGFCFLTFSIHAQFFNGIGFMGGVTFAKQKWYFNDVEETQKKKFKLGYNVCVFAEFFSGNYVRWRSEIQYNQKGCVSKSDTAKYKNKIDYLCWNNFLIFRAETTIGIPYILIGPRLEYRFKQATTSPEIIGNFNTFQVSPSVGAGWEFIVYSSFKPLIEIHYNPDIKLNAYKIDPLEIKNRAWELRLGLKYTFVNSSRGEKCPPVYL